jgi:hypothetical protein
VPVNRDLIEPAHERQKPAGSLPAARLLEVSTSQLRRHAPCRSRAGCWFAIPAYFGWVLGNPRTACFCQPVASTICCSVAPPARVSRSRPIAFLLNSRGTRGVLGPGAGVGALAAFAFRAALGATWGAGVAAFGGDAAPRFWMVAQIRVVADLRSVNFLTGLRSPKGGTGEGVPNLYQARAGGEAGESQ